MKIAPKNRLIKIILFPSVFILAGTLVFVIVNASELTSSYLNVGGTGSFDKNVLVAKDSADSSNIGLEIRRGNLILPNGTIGVGTSAYSNIGIRIVNSEHGIYANNTTYGATGGVAYGSVGLWGVAGPGGNSIHAVGPAYIAGNLQTQGYQVVNTNGAVTGTGISTSFSLLSNPAGGCGSGTSFYFTNGLLTSTQSFYVDCPY